MLNSAQSLAVRIYSISVDFLLTSTIESLLGKFENHHSGNSQAILYLGIMEAILNVSIISKRKSNSPSKLFFHGGTLMQIRQNDFSQL